MLSTCKLSHCDSPSARLVALQRQSDRALLGGREPAGHFERFRSSARPEHTCNTLLTVKTGARQPRLPRNYRRSIRWSDPVHLRESLIREGGVIILHVKPLRTESSMICRFSSKGLAEGFSLPYLLSHSSTAARLFCTQQQCHQSRPARPAAHTELQQSSNLRHHACVKTRTRRGLQPF